MLDYIFIVSFKKSFWKSKMISPLCLTQRY